MVWRDFASSDGEKKNAMAKPFIISRRYPGKNVTPMGTKEKLVKTKIERWMKLGELETMLPLHSRRSGEG